MALICVDGQRDRREPRIAPTGGELDADGWDDCVVCGAEVCTQYTAEGRMKASGIRHRVVNCLGRDGVRRMIAKGEAAKAERRRHSRWEDG